MWPDVDATDTGADVNSLLTLKQHTYVTIRQAPEVQGAEAPWQRVLCMMCNTGRLFSCSLCVSQL